MLFLTSDTLTEIKCQNDLLSLIHAERMKKKQLENNITIQIIKGKKIKKKISFGKRDKIILKKKDQKKKKERKYY